MKNTQNNSVSASNRMFTISRKQRFIVSGSLVAILAGLFGVFALVGNALDKPPISDYASCITSTGSVLQESYPDVCVTKDGARFQNPTQLAPKQ